MRHSTKLITTAIGLMFSASLFAGTCEIHFTRTACPGQEATSYSKCDGKQSCAETHPAASVADCKTMAMAACENKRLDITKSKVITAKFDGKPIKSDAGEDDFCNSYAKRAAEFNHCGS